MTDTQITEGQLVRHLSRPDWGLGKVLALHGKDIIVYFAGPESEEERQKKFRVGFPALVLAETQSDPILDGITYNAASKSADIPGRKAVKRSVTGLSRKITSVWTHQWAVQEFMKKFPEGFSDSGYLEEERTYKWEAHELYQSTLGQGQAEELLCSGRIKEVVDHLLKIESKTNLLFRMEKMALRDGLTDSPMAQTFVESLLALIDGVHPSKERFELLVQALKKLPSEKGKSHPVKWPIISVFPFLAKPERFIFLKPDPTRRTAERLGFVLQYHSEPDWLTYQKLHELADKLLEELREYGARDFIDVQSFMWVSAQLEKKTG